MTVTYDTSTGLRALDGTNLVSDIDAGFLALAQDVRTKLLNTGSSSVATEESRSSGTGALTTADSVSITVPSLALVEIFAWADVKQSAAGSALLLQLDGVASTIATGSPTLTNTYRSYITKDASTTLAEVGGVFVVGQVVLPNLSAGSHTISFLYQPPSGGSITAKNRNLRVRVLTF